MAVLNPQAEEKLEEDKTTALNKDASVQFIHAFGEEHLFNIFLKPHDFDNMMKMIDGYKHEPFYAALLLAAVSAYRFDRSQNLNVYTSQLGYWAGYSREQVLEAADSLIESIMANRPISTEITAIQRGKVGQVTQRYEEFLDPAKSVSMFNGLLLKFIGPG